MVVGVRYLPVLNFSAVRASPNTSQATPMRGDHSGPQQGTQLTSAKSRPRAKRPSGTRCGGTDPLSQSARRPPVIVTRSTVQASWMNQPVSLTEFRRMNG